MRKAISTTLLILIMATTGRAQSVYTYQFYNNLLASGQGPKLTAVCPPTFSAHTFTNLKGAVHPVCHFDKACGFVFEDTGNLLARGGYTIEMYMALDVAGGYVKLIDYKNLADDVGLYDNQRACTFRGPGSVSGEYFEDARYSFVTITRDAGTKEVKMYVNGGFVDGFTDSDHDYAVYDGNKTLRFLQDDKYSSGSETSSGNIAFLRIYNYPLDAVAVKIHYASLDSTLRIKPVSKI